jgi:hypothetical protein
MKKPLVVIIFATLYLIFFYASPHIGIPDEVIIPMMVISPIVVVYMVFVVLKYGKPSGHTFEDRFYEDYDYKRSKYVK